MELSFRDRDGEIEGTFTVLSETGEDVDKGMAFEIVQAERSCRNLRFIVPITGEVDDDAILFELMLEEDRLKGHGRELREGSDNLPITFTKQE